MEWLEEGLAIRVSDLHNHLICACASWTFRSLDIVGCDWYYTAFQPHSYLPPCLQGFVWCVILWYCSAHNRCIKNCGEKLNPSSTLSLEGKCDTSGTCLYEWQIYKADTENAEKDKVGSNETEPYILTSTTSRYLVVKEGFFKGGKFYSIKLLARRSQKGAQGYTTEKVEVNSPPKNGSFRVDPKKGVILKEQFNLSCSGWKDEDPLEYEILYSKQADTGFQTYLRSKDPHFYLKSFPGGDPDKNNTLHLLLRVWDSHGAFSEAKEDIQVSGCFNRIQCDFGFENECDVERFAL